MVVTYLRREAELGKDMLKTMSRIMAYWTLNALKRTPMANKQDITDYYMYKIRHRGIRKKNATKLYCEMTDTLAVLLKLWYGESDGDNTRYATTNAELQRMAKRYIAKKRFAAGMHRAGYLPALKELRTRPGQPLPKLKNYPGAIERKMDKDELSIVATNFAKVIAEIAPNAFEDGGAILAERLSEYLIQDMLDAQKAAGLLVR